MADSKRLRALKAFCEVIREVRGPDAGYNYDVSNAVFRGRMFFGPEDPTPMVSVLDNPDPDRWPSRTGMDEHSHTGVEKWHLLVQGWAPEDRQNPTDPAFNLMADVVKALARINLDPNPATAAPFDNPHYMLGGLITGMTMEPGVVRPPLEAPSNKAFFWMRVALQFVEDTNDPYA
jgi:hypothetical protein